MTDGDSRTGGEQRAPGERRRYNRRRTEDVSPPYYEAFERIAVALEGIYGELARREIALPPTTTRPSSRTTSRAR